MGLKRKHKLLAPGKNPCLSPQVGAVDIVGSWEQGMHWFGRREVLRREGERVGKGGS